MKQKLCLVRAISKITRWHGQLLYFPPAEVAKHFSDDRVVCYKKDNNLLGFGLWQLYQGGKLLYIQALFVDPRYRGQGYLRPLFKDIFAKARSRGAEAAFLFTRSPAVEHVGKSYNFQKISFWNLPFKVRCRLIGERLSLKRIPTYIKHGISIFSAASSQVFFTREVSE